MTETVIEERATSKNDQWPERIAEQERSGLSVRQFCKERGLTECSFYAWCKRLWKKETVRFALVEREGARQESATRDRWHRAGRDPEDHGQHGDRHHLGPPARAGFHVCVDHRGAGLEIHPRQQPITVLVNWWAALKK